MDKGALGIVQPGEAASHWQPVPANGFVEVLVARTHEVTEKATQRGGSLAVA